MKYYRNIGKTGRAGATLKLNIPYEIVAILGLKEGDTLELEPEGNGFFVKKIMPEIEVKIEWKK